MMPQPTLQPFQTPWNFTPRSDLIFLLRTALSVGEVRFARQAAYSWLAYYPGDLPVKLLYARALEGAGNEKHALAVLESMLLLDPEDLDAWKALSRLARKSHRPDGRSSKTALLLADSEAAIEALGGPATAHGLQPSWAKSVRQGRAALVVGDLSAAEEQIHRALVVEPLPALVAAIHMRVALQRMPTSGIEALATHYHQRFPSLQVPALVLGSCLVQGGASEKGVALLHQSAAQDVSGQVSGRLWGPEHPYQDLWPDQMEAPLELLIPAGVAAALGWNRLEDVINRPGSGAAAAVQNGPTATVGAQADPSSYMDKTAPIGPKSPEIENAGATIPVITLGGPQQPAGARSTHELDSRSSPQPYTIPETLRPIQAELERVAANLKRKQLARADGRFPVYVIFTTRQGLEKQYGSAATEEIERALKRLAAAISARPDWSALVLYADDPDCTSTLSLRAARPEDPWSLKLVISDLDAVLARQGEMIGALLIVGGPEVVPFHLLPNPVDDGDAEVPSDSPYATQDENYFIPEWPVGRLPGGASRDPQALLSGLNKIITRHTELARKIAWHTRWLARVRNLFSFQSMRVRPSWGYTAAVWRRASLSVFRPIGEPHAMLVSPPKQSTVPSNNRPRRGQFPEARLGYFNLHGLPDASEWYGQKDPADQTNQLDYPVALRPQDVINSGRAPQVVFSEACFGAHIVDKDIEEALALKFLASGSQAVVGSTCISYGSVTTPLIASDLLGQAFWKYLRENLTVGEALRRAKIHLAREMNRRQGYLDGEDQKTLISYVLYGDPLAHYSPEAPRTKAILRPVDRPNMVKTICDRTPDALSPTTAVPHSPTEANPVSPEMLAQVKNLVEQYLPGMRDASMTFSRAHAGCTGQGHTCPTYHFGAKTQPVAEPQRSVVTLSKAVSMPAVGATPPRTHQHYARLTLDNQGQVVKMSVSR